MARTRDEALAKRRQAEILDAAARCFVRDGVHQTSIREICVEAKLSSGAVYNHYSSKDAIIEATAARERREIDELAAYLASAQDIAAAIPAVVGEMIRWTTPDAAKLSIELLSEASRNQHVASALAANDRLFRRTLLEAIKRARKTGGFAPDPSANDQLEIVISVFEGFVGRIAIGPAARPKRFADLAEKTLRAVLFA